MWQNFISWVEWHPSVVELGVFLALVVTLIFVIKYANAARKTADYTKPLAELAAADLEIRYVPRLLFGAYPTGSNKSNVVEGGWRMQNKSFYDAIAQPTLTLWLNGQELSVPEEIETARPKDFSGGEMVPGWSRR